MAGRCDTHGYYGSISHNVKAIYQRYMGWYDGNPANLWTHPPGEVAVRYVQAMGGRDAALRVAQGAWDDGDYRWCAEVGKHLVFADDSDAQARALLADALEQLGYGAENGTWRNAYLAGATELRAGVFGTPATTSPDMMRALTVPQMFDGVAVRIDGPRAWDEKIDIAWHIVDDGQVHLTRLRHGVLSHRVVETAPEGVTTFTLPRLALLGLISGNLHLPSAIADGTVGVVGDPAVLERLVGLIAPVDPDFPIVTP